MYEHAVDLVHSAKASEQEAMAKAAGEIEAKLKKADMARAAHLDEMKDKATRQSEHEMAVKAAREELSTKLVDEFRDRDVTVLPPTLNVMSLEELMAALEIEDNHKKVLEVLLAKPEFVGDDATTAKLEAVSANQRALTEAIDALMPAVMQCEIKPAAGEVEGDVGGTSAAHKSARKGCVIA